MRLLASHREYWSELHARQLQRALQFPLTRQCQPAEPIVSAGADMRLGVVEKLQTPISRATVCELAVADEIAIDE